MPGSTDSNARYGILESLDLKGEKEGPLNGTAFVVKDLFDVTGFRTGAGNPRWLQTHEEASDTAPAVLSILDAGARLIGKTLTDEFACSLDGINEHFPVPLNSLYPDRIPGGSSSGSASCVAASISDFALGTDTVGSIRVPAAYCGLFGFRPTHSAVTLNGVRPLGPSFDTACWLARRAELLERVGSVLLPRASAGSGIKKIVLLESAFDLVDKELRDGTRNSALACAAGLEIDPGTRIDCNILDIWASAFNLIRGREAWQIYGDWLCANSSSVSPAILERLSVGAMVSLDEEDLARRIIDASRDLVDNLLREERAVCLPTVTRLPPRLDSSVATLAANRKDNIRLTVIASVFGLPQVTLPIKLDCGTVFSISFLASPGRDRDLLALASRLEAEGLCRSGEAIS
ncbi:MAG: amidase [Candidatus Melainabacteria bacterium]|nr:amidase [Candidatus Melainabacteria bacterium]